MDNYKEEIENYYQIEELYKNKLVEGKVRNIKCSLTDSRVSIGKDYNDSKLKLDKYFIIPFSCLERLYTEGDDPVELPFEKGEALYSAKDDVYLDMFIVDWANSRIFCTPIIDRLYWNKSVFLNPASLNYWFDFLDTEGELKQFSVRAIGARTKAINENTIKSIYFREVPQVIFEKQINWNEPKMSGYKYIQIPDLDKMFTISARGKSAKERLDELLYAHSYCVESASITAIPIYYLQPNTRVNISDPKTKLFGDYIVSKITIPLSHNGTMSLTTTKAAQTLFL